MPFITILDFTLGEVHIHEYDESTGLNGNSTRELNTEELVRHFGYNESNCQYLCTDNLKLQIHSIDEKLQHTGNYH